MLEVTSVIYSDSRTRQQKQTVKVMPSFFLHQGKNPASVMRLSSSSPIVAHVSRHAPSAAVLSFCVYSVALISTCVHPFQFCTWCDTSLLTRLVCTAWCVLVSFHVPGCVICPWRFPFLFFSLLHENDETHHNTDGRE